MKFKHTKIVENFKTHRREYYNAKQELIAYEPLIPTKDIRKPKHV